MTFTERILKFLDEREMGKCELPDSTGLYTCNQPVKVSHIYYEAPMCMRCWKERP